jgi:hypothetical protein
MGTGVKRQGREADHSSPSSAEVKNAWGYTSTPQYALMAWCSFKKHRDSFIFIFYEEGTLFNVLLEINSVLRRNNWESSLCEFRCSGSATDQIFSIRQILERKWDYNGIVHHLVNRLEKAHDSVRREALYSILIKSCII